MFLIREKARRHVIPFAWIAVPTANYRNSTARAHRNLFALPQLSARENSRIRFADGQRDLEPIDTGIRARSLHRQPLAKARG